MERGSDQAADTQEGGRMDKIEALEREQWRQEEGADFRRSARQMFADANRLGEPGRTWVRNLARQAYETARRVEAGEADHLRDED